MVAIYASVVSNKATLVYITRTGSSEKYCDVSWYTNLEAGHIYAMVNEYYCNPDKVNNLIGKDINIHQPRNSILVPEISYEVYPA